MDRDIIGDIHGQADKLTALLTELGYRERQGAWRHPTRKACFVGDYIDRGPGQLRTLNLVRAMIEADSAEGILGNHEFNGIAFYLPDGDTHLRHRNAKNRHQHQAFLSEVGEDSPLHREWIQWFLQRPLWIETPDFRVVHACWHAQAMDAIADRLGPNNTLTPELIEAASRKGSMEYEHVENICKGLEVELPPGMVYTDSDGTARTRTRVRWWDEEATTYRQAALVNRAEQAQLPDEPIPEAARVHYDQAKPVFFGHYWFTGTPQVLSPKMCCVDYSAARDAHPLVAYRWQGEPTLTADHLVAVGPTLSPSQRLRRHP